MKFYGLFIFAIMITLCSAAWARPKVQTLTCRPSEPVNLYRCSPLESFELKLTRRTIVYGKGWKLIDIEWNILSENAMSWHAIMAEQPDPIGTIAVGKFNLGANGFEQTGSGPSCYTFFAINPDLKTGWLQLEKDIYFRGASQPVTLKQKLPFVCE